MDDMSELSALSSPTQDYSLDFPLDIQTYQGAPAGTPALCYDIDSCLEHSMPQLEDATVNASEVNQAMVAYGMDVLPDHINQDEISAVSVLDIYNCVHAFYNTALSAKILGFAGLSSSSERNSQLHGYSGGQCTFEPCRLWC